MVKLKDKEVKMLQKEFNINGSKGVEETKEAGHTCGCAEIHVMIKDKNTNKTF